LTDGAEIRTKAASLTVHAVTVHTCPLASEDDPAARRIAGGRTTGSGFGDRPQVGDDPRRLFFGEIVGRHRRSRDAVPDDSNQVLIGRRATKLATAQIDAGNFVSVWAVTVRTAILEDAPTIVDVGSRVVLSEECGARQ
jgi:hypothetical protein